jgi:hypothetical protein
VLCVFESVDELALEVLHISELQELSLRKTLEQASLDGLSHELPKSHASHAEVNTDTVRVTLDCVPDPGWMIQNIAFMKGNLDAILFDLVFVFVLFRHIHIVICPMNFLL